MSPKRSPIIPGEHGAWALLYGPFLVTLAVDGSIGLRAFLFLVAITALFLAHEPLARLVRSRKYRVAPRQRERWLLWLRVYISLLVVSTALLLSLYRLWLLVPIGAAAVTTLALHLAFMDRRAERRLAAQLLGVFGLTAVAPATWYVIRGQLDTTALVLWAVNILYFSSGVFHVKMVVSRHTKTRTAAARSVQSFLYHLLLLALIVAFAWRGSLPMLLALAFLPVLVRAFWGLVSPPGKLNLKRVGYSEVAHTVLFIILAVAGLSGGAG